MQSFSSSDIFSAFFRKGPKLSEVFSLPNLILLTYLQNERKCYAGQQRCPNLRVFFSYFVKKKILFIWIGFLSLNFKSLNTNLMS